jgi:hypothetical protein
MPNRYWLGKKHSKETKKKMSETRKGMKFTEEWKRNMSESHKGLNTWCKGKHLTEEHKKKISQALKGRHTKNEFKKGHIVSEETRKKLSISHQGKKQTERWKIIMKERMTGDKNPAKRLDVRKKISIAKIGKSNWKIKGEKCHLWKGGITPLVFQIRTCFKYRQWRSDVFTRDDFTCQECGEKENIKLEAHHYPKKLSEILEEYQIKTLEQAMNCEELWSLNNGKTLCRKCHIKIKNNV